MIAVLFLLSGALGIFSAATGFRNGETGQRQLIVDLLVTAWMLGMALWLQCRPVPKSGGD